MARPSLPDELKKGTITKEEFNNRKEMEDKLHGADNLIRDKIIPKGLSKSLKAWKILSDKCDSYMKLIGLGLTNRAQLSKLSSENKEEDNDVLLKILSGKD